MNQLKVRNIVLGEGIPKICVPIVGKTMEEIKEQAEEAAALCIDLVEWRMDWYENIESNIGVAEILNLLRGILGDIPLLATFRTKQEGGERAITKKAYSELLKCVIENGNADLVDVELFMGEDTMRELVAFAHKNHVWIVASNHDFSKTPEKEEMIRRLCKMQDLGADVLKIAVMPNSERDVLTLLDMTVEMKEMYAKRPLITMSMSDIGMISRLAGGCFGSSVTFGAAKKASAPGQISVEKLREALSILHKQ